MAAFRQSAKHRGTTLCTVLFPALLFSSAAVNAQDGQPGTDDVEEIVVTGTRIKRRDFSSPSPISSLDKAILDYSGQPTLEVAINQMPQAQPDFGRTSNNPGDGTARVNLRGLGAERTLVMLNGRRLAPPGANSAFDINILPQALIGNVEIITGGASTVYGSDAVAGVVNFVTREGFEGLSFEASSYLTEEADSGVNDINVLFGTSFAGGRGHVQAFGGVLDRDASFASDRAFTAIPFEDNLQGDIIEGGSFAIPETVVLFPPIDLGSGPGPIRFDPNGDPVPFIDPDDRYNFAAVNYLQTPLQRYSGGLILDYALSERAEGYLELIHTQSDVGRNLAAVPIGAFFVINTDNPTLTSATQQIVASQFLPVAPGLASFGARRRMLEVGPRIIDLERDYTRAVAGMRGSLTDTWDYDVWVSYTDSDSETLLRNAVSQSRLEQGLLVSPATGECFDPSNGCVPVELFGAGRVSPAAANFIRLPALTNTGSRRQKLASGYITGAPVENWAGPVDVALGMEWRSDEGRFSADSALFLGDALGYLGDAAVIGREEVLELYAETVVPLASDAPFARYLGLELGARRSKYNNAGKVDSYKLGAQWAPVDPLRFRAMFQRSVRAPNLEEAFQQQFRQAGFFVENNPSLDPCSASADPVGRGFAERCILQGIPAGQIGVFEATPATPTISILGGNPELEPEQADTLTLGAVLQLDSLAGLQIAVDFYDLEVTDTIGEIDPAQICFDPRNTSNVFCSNLRRDPITFNVVEVFAPVSNRGAFEVSGVDVQFAWQGDLPDRFAIGNDGARLSADLTLSHLSSKSAQLNPVSTPLECRGLFGAPCDSFRSGETFPMNRATTHLNYLAGDLVVNLTWRWISGSDNALPLLLEQRGLDNVELQIPEIGSTSYVDLGVGYDVTEKLGLALNVVNMLDRDPPFTANATTSNNTDTTMYDIFGRAYQLRLRMQF